MLEKTACFTGHRILPKDRIPMITQLLKTTVSQLVSKGVIFYGCGGAIGFDMLAGFSVLEMKKEYPQIKLILVLPCMNQDMKWRQPDRDRYHELSERADKKVLLQRDYDDGCMLRRNRHLVDNSGFCIAYLTQNKGGSFYTVNYANSKGRNVINLAEPHEKAANGISTPHRK